MERGHEVRALTLAGLGEILARATNFVFHIDEALQAIKETPGDVALVGQSYARMVIAGAADVDRANIRALVYVDAYVPQTSESVWSLTSSRSREAFIAGGSSIA